MSTLQMQYQYKRGKTDRGKSTVTQNCGKKSHFKQTKTHNYNPNPLYQWSPNMIQMLVFKPQSKVINITKSQVEIVTLK